MHSARGGTIHIALWKGGLERMEEVLCFQDHLYIFTYALDKTHKQHLEHDSGL